MIHTGISSYKQYKSSNLVYTVYTRIVYMYTLYTCTLYEYKYSTILVLYTYFLYTVYEFNHTNDWVMTSLDEIRFVTVTTYLDNAKNTYVYTIDSEHSAKNKLKIITWV